LGITEDWFSTAQYFDIKTLHHGLEDVAIAIGGNENLTVMGNLSVWVRFTYLQTSYQCWE